MVGDRGFTVLEGGLVLFAVLVASQLAIAIGFSTQTALWLVVGVPMFAVTIVWKRRRDGHREDFGLVEATLLWTAVSQMVVVFGLAGWMLVPSYRVAPPIETVLATEILGVVCGTLVVTIDWMLWWATGRLPSRSDQPASANQQPTDNGGRA